MDYILKSVALYSAMQKATSEAEFQQLLAADDVLNDSRRTPRFAHRTLAAMKATTFYEGVGFMGRMPDQRPAERHVLKVMRW